MHLLLSTCFHQYNWICPQGIETYCMPSMNWSIPSRYGNLFCVAQSISHIVNAAVSQTNNLQNPIRTSTVSSQWLWKKAEVIQRCGRPSIPPPPPTAITVDKQLDVSQGNCLESWHRLCIICWQNCQWVNDHGQLAERRRALIPLCLHLCWHKWLSLFSLPLMGAKTANTNKGVSDDHRAWRSKGGYLHLMCEFTSTAIGAVWRLN